MKGARTVRVLPFYPAGYEWGLPVWAVDERIAEVELRTPVGNYLLQPMRHDELWDRQDQIEERSPGFHGVPAFFTVCNYAIHFDIRPAYSGSLRIVTQDRQ